MNTHPRARRWAAVAAAQLAALLLWAAALADDDNASTTTAPKIIAPLPLEPPPAPKVEIKTHNPIDQVIAADEQFLRRVYLDLSGVTPTLDEVGEFIKQSRPDRAKLIDKLLGSPRYADHWAVMWGDLLREETNIRGSAPFAFRDYIRESLRENKPLDRWVTELITAEGDTSKNPAGLFFMRHDGDAEELTITLTQVFLGTQLKCAQCHDHKFEPWLQKDFQGMRDFWRGTRQRRLREDTVTLPNGRTREVPVFEIVTNREGHGTFLTDLASEKGRGREALAELMVSPKNPYFARTIVNRLWARLMGVGLVDPVDGFSATNPPSHPELLDWLARDFIEHGYDPRHTIRLICNSRTYQLASTGGVIAGETGQSRLFQRMPLRRMTAEQLHDSILASCGLLGEQAWEPAIEQVYPPRGGSFLATFGAHDRQTVHERTSEPTIPQALELINGSFLNDAVQVRGRNALAVWMRETNDAGVLIQRLYWQTLTREPTKSETQIARKHLKAGGFSPEAWADLHWALVNTREFMFIP